MSQGPSPMAIEALLDLVEPPAPTSVNDADLLRLALGIADGPTRLACARAMLVDPGVRTRLRRIRNRMLEELDRISPDEISGLLEEATNVQRLLAEGRWRDGSAKLRVRLDDLRRGWRAACASEDHASVEAYVRALLQPLMEMAEWDAFDDLARAGLHAASTLGDKLRRNVLALQGVAASKRGDSSAAIGFWTERLRLARAEGNRGVEVDTLTDLASQAISEGDTSTCRKLIALTEVALDDLDREDLRAGLDVVRAGERRLEGDLRRSAQYARRAISRLSIRLGADSSAFVRIHAAQALAACGERQEAIGLWADAIGIAVDAGLSAHASESLRMIGEALEDESMPHLALMCLDVAWAIDSTRGTSRAGKSGALRAQMRFRHPEIVPLDVDGEAWTSSATEVLSALRDATFEPTGAA